jgi:DNA repair exonuclease SbcCD ATPase subunit
MDWLDNFSFSDLVLAGSTFIAAIAAYFNLNNKLDSVSGKIEELEETQKEIKSDLKESEINHKKEMLESAHKATEKMTAIEDRQRVFDLFMARFEEKMNYLSDQLRQITSMLEKKNDK